MSSWKFEIYIFFSNNNKFFSFYMLQGWFTATKLIWFIIKFPISFKYSEFTININIFEFFFTWNAIFFKFYVKSAIILMIVLFTTQTLAIAVPSFNMKFFMFLWSLIIFIINYFIPFTPGFMCMIATTNFNFVVFILW